MAKLFQAVERKGMTIVPVEMYFNAKGIAKLKLALAEGKSSPTSARMPPSATGNVRKRGLCARRVDFMGEGAWPYPAPRDDGAAGHLVAGVELPDIELPTTTGDRLSLAKISGLSIVFVYPWTGRPGIANPPGWDAIAGAHGSTPRRRGSRR